MAGAADRIEEERQLLLQIFIDARHAELDVFEFYKTTKEENIPLIALRAIAVDLMPKYAARGVPEADIIWASEALRRTPADLEDRFGGDSLPLELQERMRRFDRARLPRRPAYKGFYPE